MKSLYNIKPSIVESTFATSFYQTPKKTTSEEIARSIKFNYQDMYSNLQSQWETTFDRQVNRAGKGKFTGLRTGLHGFESPVGIGLIVLIVAIFLLL